jgi:hypothetical protein
VLSYFSGARVGARIRCFVRFFFKVRWENVKGKECAESTRLVVDEIHQLSGLVRHEEET